MLGLLYIRLPSKTRVVYGVSEHPPVAAGAGFLASAGYKLQLARKRSRTIANSTLGVTFEET